MTRSSEMARNQQSREVNRLSFRLKVILALAVLGLASPAISGYTIYHRDRYAIASTPTPTPVFTPTPMFPVPYDAQSCRFIPPDQVDIYTEPYQGGKRIRGGKLDVYLLGDPNTGKFLELSPGQKLPQDGNNPSSQFWACRRNFIPILASPTP